MHILSVNIGKAIPFDNNTGSTGIYKKPQVEAVQIHELGLQGDEIADLDNHGGLDQAVYLYGQPDYDWWVEAESRPMAPAMFGENLTISELESQKVLIGDRFEIGTVVLEATSPRIPCATFSIRMEDRLFVKKFHKANRPGVYCRVIKTGSVREGDAVKHVPYAGVPIHLTEMMEDYINPSPERMRYLLQAPIHHKSVEDYAKKLAKLES